MDKAEIELSGAFNAARVMGKYPEFLSDLNGVSYIAGGIEGSGFGVHTEIFNDNITLKLNPGGSSLAVAITAARLAIREALGEGVRVMRADNNQSIEHVKFLVTLPSTDIDTVLSMTAAGRQTLKDAGLTLSDIDFTIDCENITTRGDVERWIASRYIIVDRRDRTGDNCISWLIEDPRFGKIRCKVYNKAVQMVESGGVRVVIGSSVHEYIAGDVKTQNTLFNYKSHGVSRIELTFYDETLYGADVYREVVLRVYNELSTCKTYVNSLENQWRSLEARLTQVLAVYEPESRTFGICQWWNSLTGKMQGTSTVINKDGDLMKLLGNYSFNSRPIHLITVTDRNEVISSYMRIGTGQPVTMLPGVRGGLYSARKEGMRSLSEYGIGTVSPGLLDWVPSMSYRTRAMAELEPYVRNEPDVDDLTRDLELLNVRNRGYVAVYDGLLPDTIYTIVGVGRGVFRRKECIYVTTSTGQRVRCGPYLEAIVKEQEMRETSSIFTIRTGKKVTVHGNRDMQCYIA